MAVSLALIGQAAPAYLRWVGWGLRDAVVVPAEPGPPLGLAGLRVRYLPTAAGPPVAWWVRVT